MILGIATLVIALLISSVSAWYSILGLTAIFAGATVPAIIMGGALESGKVMVAIWLHQNWKRDRLLKFYLVPALVFLMLLTSVGVFGFLSKAHLDQSVPSGDIQAQVQLFDEKIQTQRDNIAAARRALQQMDAAVDQIMGRSTDEQGADKAANLRRSQARERTQLQNDISRAQKEIATLQEQRAPVASQYRKVEAEVGPIKYVAALFSSGAPDQDMLERAVRWVIILIVIVFDPLAIILIIAGISQLGWYRQKSGSSAGYVPDESGKTIDEQIEEIEPEPSQTKTVPDTVTEEEEEAWKQLEAQQPMVVVPSSSPITSYTVTTTYSDPEPEVDVEEANRLAQEAMVDREPEYTIVGDADEEDHSAVDAELAQARQEAELLAQYVAEREAELQAEIEKLRAQVLANVPHPTNTDNPVDFPAVEEPVIEPEPEPEPIIETPADNGPNFEAVRMPGSQEWVQTGPKFEEPKAEQLTRPIRSDFGSSFPNDPERGDMFLRTDFKPSRLFKWNDVKWIEVNKATTDVYNYNDAYIQFLADKLSTGEYSADDLTENELQQVQRAIGGYRV